MNELKSCIIVLSDKDASICRTQRGIPVFANPLIIEQVSEPFHHFTIRSLFSDDKMLKRLGLWLHNFTEWDLEIGRFYQQYGFDLSAHPLCDEACELTSPHAVKSLLEICERAFGEIFFPAVTFTAHKLVPKQHIDIHTDASSSHTTQTHRLVVQVPGPKPVEGGDLMLFSSRESIIPVQKYKPAPNSTFGFQFGPKSFHAVSPVILGIRYSLIISFKASLGLAKDQILTTFPAHYSRRLFPSG
jgi:hypothetical protein